MCYNVEALKKNQAKKAAHLANIGQLNLAELGDFHLISGFQHPSLIIHKNNQEGLLSQWGLIPEFVSDDKKEQFSNKTLNARIETIFEKKSFAPYARENRGVFYIDSFYDYHHVGSNKCAIRITSSEAKGFWIGCLYTEQKHSTFSMLTQPAQGKMKLVHNKNPESRMPLILKESEFELFYKAPQKELIDYFTYARSLDFNLQAVPPLSGAKSLGNNVLQKSDFEYSGVNLSHLGIQGSQLSMF